jgi:peptidoglycan hydrolase-like protein with peptidoglycan-binding domain
MWAYGESTRSYISNNGGTDGVFGTGTYNAVLSFQKSRNTKLSTSDRIDEDGIVGPDTWEQIGTISTISHSTGSSLYHLRIYSENYSQIYYYGYANNASVSPSSTTSASTWYYYNRTASTTGYQYAFKR